MSEYWLLNFSLYFSRGGWLGGVEKPLWVVVGVFFVVFFSQLQ